MNRPSNGGPTAKETSTQKVIYAALVANLLIALSKFIAAFLTSSSSILSEGVHSLVDTGDQLLLLYGITARKSRPIESTHSDTARRYISGA